jgi:LPS sulfotransferase NodH
MEPELARRSYLVCSVQRAGSWLLCHALEDTGVLGRPAEYFHRGDEPFWRGRWGAASEDAFLRAVQREPVTANRVWGSKMMWNYLADAVARLRAWPRLHLATDAADPEVLGAAFPGLAYVWLRREDKLRQAISWWRAAATGQYGLAAGEVPAEPPAFDRDAIGRLLQYAQGCEAGWRDWFAAHSIRPLEIVYEDLIEDVDRAARNVAGFLHVPLSAGLEQVRPRGRRQADHHTERLVALFNRHS